MTDTPTPLRPTAAFTPDVHALPPERMDVDGYEPDDEMSMDEIEERLMRLREPFPPEQIEKLPKPKWKGAWDNERGSHCDECHGYHVLSNCIHLDYVGHALVTDRLLQVDPFWSWEPMATTADGLPLFSDKGMWINLTICGVTRIGYGDGASVKEVIGDAIRNAAMRFGVALDLWSKADLHAERNPGDGQTPRRQGRDHAGDSAQLPAAQRRNGSGGRAAAVPDEPPPRAANQDAIDALASVCDSEGLDAREMAARFRREHDNTTVADSDADTIMAFAATLLAETTPDPEPFPESTGDLF